MDRKLERAVALANYEKGREGFILFLFLLFFFFSFFLFSFFFFFLIFFFR